MLDSFFLHFLDISQTQAYLIIFFGILFEGDISLFTSGYLVSLGLFQREIILFLAVLSAAIADFFCYFLGKNIYRFPKKLNQGVEKLVGNFDQALKKRTFFTIFFGKFFYGLHFLFLIRAGTLKIPITQFIKSDGLSAILWILIIFSFGFVSGASFTFVGKFIKYSELTLLVGLILFFAVRKLLDHYFRNKFNKFKE